MGFLHAEQCCLYVIDPQERLMAHIHESGTVVKNIALMLRLAAAVSIPVIASTQYKKGIGPLVPELAELLSAVPCPDKVEFNGLDNLAVRQTLDRLPTGVDTLLLCGVESHICVYQTALGALDAGYKVWVIADAVSSRTAANNRFGRQRLRELGVTVAPAEMILYELLRKAGTPAFKAMLPFIRD